MGAHAADYAEQGFLVVPRVVGPAEVAALNAAAEQVCREHGALLKPDGALRHAGRGLRASGAAAEQEGA